MRWRKLLLDDMGCQAGVGTENKADNTKCYDTIKLDIFAHTE